MFIVEENSGSHECKFLPNKGVSTTVFSVRCQAKEEQISQSGPKSDLGVGHFKVTFLPVVLHSLGSDYSNAKKERVLY